VAMRRPPLFSAMRRVQPSLSANFKDHGNAIA